jgi:hypothetical protein
MAVVSKQALRDRLLAGRMRKTVKQARIFKELMKLRQRGEQDAGITEAIQELTKKRLTAR